MQVVVLVGQLITIGLMGIVGLVVLMTLVLPGLPFGMGLERLLNPADLFVGPLLGFLMIALFQELDAVLSL